MNRNHGLTKAASIALGLCILAGIVTGCRGESHKEFYSSEYDYGTRQGGDAKGLNGTRLYGNMIKGADHHDNEKIRFNEYIANELVKMPGVAMAYVVETDKNAYVAVMFDASATGVRMGGKQETNNVGETHGTYVAETDSPTVRNPRDVATGYNNYYTEKDNEHLSHEFKQAIAKKVRHLNPYAHEVFISANRDFVNAVNGLAIERWVGNPLSTPHNVKEFNTLAERIFPDNSPE